MPLGGLDPFQQSGHPESQLISVSNARTCYGQYGKYLHGRHRPGSITPNASMMLMQIGLTWTAAHEARWDAADEQIGYSATKRVDVEVGVGEQELIDTLTGTPATSVAGKLNMIFHEGAVWEDDTEFPQSQIRIGQVTEPNVFMPGSDREGSCDRRPSSGA